MQGNVVGNSHVHLFTQSNKGRLCVNGLNLIFSMNAFCKYQEVKADLHDTRNAMN